MGFYVFINVFFKLTFVLTAHAQTNIVQKMCWRIFVVVVTERSLKPYQATGKPTSKKELGLPHFQFSPQVLILFSPLFEGVRFFCKLPNCFFGITLKIPKSNCFQHAFPEQVTFAVQLVELVISTTTDIFR